MIDRLGPVPTLIERDHDVPALSVLLAEAGRADARDAATRVAPWPPRPTGGGA